MTSSGLTKAFAEKALADVDETDPESRLALFRRLKKRVANKADKRKVIPCSFLKLPEVFSFTNSYDKFGTVRRYKYPRDSISHHHYRKSLLLQSGTGSHETVPILHQKWVY